MDKLNVIIRTNGVYNVIINVTMFKIVLVCDLDYDIKRRLLNTKNVRTKYD